MKIKCVVCGSKEIIPEYTRYFIQRYTNGKGISKTPIYSCKNCYVPITSLMDC